MLPQQPEQTGDPSLILHERLPLAFMQITHFILVFSLPVCKISPLLGNPVLRDAAAGQKLKDSRDRKPLFPASRVQAAGALLLMLESVET
jgi:hypothetical protein